MPFTYSLLIRYLLGTDLENIITEKSENQTKTRGQNSRFRLDIFANILAKCGAGHKLSPRV